MKSQREKKLAKMNWHERNDKWFMPFKGTLLAGLILLVTHHCYEHLIAYLTNL